MGLRGGGLSGPLIGPRRDGHPHWHEDAEAAGGVAADAGRETQDARLEDTRVVGGRGRTRSTALLLRLVSWSEAVFCLPQDGYTAFFGFLVVHPRDGGRLTEFGFEGGDEIGILDRGALFDSFHKADQGGAPCSRDRVLSASIIA